MEHPEMEVEKMDIYFDTPEERQLAWEIVEKWEGISLAAAFSFNMEVNSALGDKGHGLERLGRELGISTDEMMAFGDGLNDVKLLAAAGLPVAVSNAVPSLKAVAKEITLSNEEDGVAISIENHILNV
jgi:hydroxymethylpyrimidine pyrophosphatase-like HAD family hydrolase